MTIDAPVFIASAGGGAGQTEIVLTVPAGGVPAGATIWVSTFSGEAIGANMGATDTAGNTYVLDQFDAAHAADNISLWLLRASNVSALAEGDTITIDLDGSVGNPSAIAAYAAGVAATDAFDQAAIAEGDSDTVDSGDITTTGEQIYIGHATRSSLSTTGWTDAGAGFTEISQNLGTGRSGILAYRIVNSPTTDAFEPTIGASDGWIAGVASYKAAAAAGQNVPEKMKHYRNQRAA